MFWFLNASSDCFDAISITSSRVRKRLSCAVVIILKKDTKKMDKNINLDFIFIKVDLIAK